MTIKSNITIKSNVYNRVSNEVENDIEFVKNVSGHKALAILDKLLYGFSIKAKLNDVQMEELRESNSCCLAKNGEITHGKALINGQVKWVCRCEYRECKNYDSCKSQNANVSRRLEMREDEVDNNSNNDLKYEYLGLDGNMEVIKLFEEQTDTAQEESSTADKQLDESNNRIVLNDIQFKQIIAPDEIIQSDITSNILVNAGPGTGKTYTVINRIIYILKNQIATPDYILVLCYTRAARDVILDRIEHEIENGMLSFDAKRINICTFDSFATMYLSAREEEFQGLDYNERIQLFNNTINKEMFEDFEYLIIDEIQDLVNDRARMVINILKNINCGYLLLGDRCQAIYDYDCGDNKTIDSVEFYKELNDILPKDISKYELIKNNRQCEELASFSNRLREELLYGDVQAQNEFAEKAVEMINDVDVTAEKFKPQVNETEKTAILCRNNGEAEYISNILNKNGIKHNLLKGSNYRLRLNRWLGDMFWDYCEPKIAKDDFIERYLARVKEDAREAEHMYDLFCDICEEYSQNSYELDMNRLISQLIKAINIPNELLAEQITNLVISTIHRAKGREFDKVYLLESKFNIKADNSEEARIRYVGITRPKKILKKLKKGNMYNWYFIKSSNGRMIKTAIKPYYKNQTYCTNLSIGLEADIDNVSFVSIINTDYLEVQEYIAKHISTGDEVEILRDEADNIYYIYHNKFKIGALSRDICNDFRNAIYKTGDKRNIPMKLTDVYISNIITIINTRYDENIPIIFRESHIWLGVELTGLGKVHFLKE